MNRLWIAYPTLRHSRADGKQQEKRKTFSSIRLSKNEMKIYRFCVYYFAPQVNHLRKKKQQDVEGCKLNQLLPHGYNAMRCASRVEKRKESQCALPRYQLSSLNGHKCDDNNVEKTSPGSAAHGEAVRSKCTYAAIKLERHVVGQTGTAINYFCVMCCWWIVMLVSHWKLNFFSTKQCRSLALEFINVLA